MLYQRYLTLARRYSAFNLRVVDIVAEALCHHCYFCYIQPKYVIIIKYLITYQRRKWNYKVILDLFTSLEDIGKTLKVRVTAKAAHNRVKMEINPETNQRLFRVYVTVAPEDGKANEAVLKLLAKELNLSKSSLEIKSGHKIKDKIIIIKT